ncbi:MAG: thioredoxin domain-containing protein, partial [Planctomycetota bacterium]
MPISAQDAGPDGQQEQGPPVPALLTNTLSQASSPYLLQHKNNPVHWQQWGPEAFELARELDKPIFLSVGYSTCYWCHVMERESFESEVIAKVINEHFIPVKVDREERPDVDTIYMNAVQIYQDGQGGWPMSVWLTPPGSKSPTDPGLEPIYAGTYFPPADAYGRMGFPELCQQISNAWQNRRQETLRQAERVAVAVRENLDADVAPVRLDTTTIGKALQSLIRAHDTTNGGFGQAPKFPQPVFLSFLFQVTPTLEDPAVQS